MKICILTQYFPPEVGAPQNRLYELAVRLVKLGVEVDVLTAMPNYPQMKIYDGYVGKRFVQEEVEGLRIFRSSIYIPKSKGIVERLKNYFSFVWSSYKIGKSKLDKSYDFVFCESPPLFLGMSGLALARNKKAKFVFNVSDLWPESAEKLDIVSNKFFLGMAYKLEAFLYRKSTFITGQTQGIVENIKVRFPKSTCYWLPNGVDLEYYKPIKASDESLFPGRKFVALYAGIIGLAQGLEIILKAAERLQDQKDLGFVLLGEGPVKEKLQSMAKTMQLDNVLFLPAVGKDKMPEILSKISCAVVPLRKLPLFEGAIPSKIFENMAMQIPVVLGVDGEARKLFVEQGKAALYFEPENDEALALQLKNLMENSGLCEDLGVNGRNFVAENFNRNQLANNLYEWFLAHK